MRLQHIEMISKELPLQDGKLDKYGSIWGTNLQHHICGQDSSARRTGGAWRGRVRAYKANAESAS